MSLGQSSSALFLQNINTGTLSNPTRTPQHVTVHPVALFAILDHYLRRTDAQQRVIGTLLGVRTDTTIEVRNSFAVLHSEGDDDGVAVDMEYHQNMLELHQKVNAKEVVVGWYSTGTNLNTYSALIQNFYSHETAPHPSVLVEMRTGTQNNEKPGFQAFLSSPVGVDPKPENCVFTPIPCDLKFQETERSGLDLLKTALAVDSHTISPATDLEVLKSSIESVIAMIDRVLTYVRAVVAGEIKGDAVVGRYLLDTLCTSTEGLDKTGFASSLQDTLMVSYLANLVRAQAEVSARLQLVS